jgi:hypothetical protein
MPGLVLVEILAFVRSAIRELRFESTIRARILATPDYSLPAATVTLREILGRMMRTSDLGKKSTVEETEEAGQATGLCVSVETRKK